MQKIRELLSGLAGIKRRSFDDDKVEIWEIPYFKIKVIWNDKSFNVFYEDKSTQEGISRVMHNFKDNEVKISLIEVYDMFKEAADGIQNSQLSTVGNNYTDQDIRNSKELSSLLINKLDTLMDILYKKESDNDPEITKLKFDEVYLLIKIDEEGYHIEGWTKDDIKARRYTSQTSFKKDYYQEQYPQYAYQILKEYE